jgi:ADP-heptose:LPS heptosyltransferase
VILRDFKAPGDAVVLTAAVNWLHANHPGKFETDIRTQHLEIWQNNPHITKLCESDPMIEQIDMLHPLINQSNQLPYHFLHAYAQYLEDRLSVRIKPTNFRGDIYLSDAEKRWNSPVQRCFEGFKLPVWLIVSGGKNDFTAKWWSPHRCQQIIDHYAGRIKFIQVGSASHHHPPLERCVNMVGKTTLRHAIELVYHCDGIICPVTMFMHLAAAVPQRPGKRPNRPCVVLGGGREAPHWYQYPGHTVLHTIRMLRCCDHGGCWRCRTVKLNDGNKKDGSLCIAPVVTPQGETLPRCMDMITAQDVIRAVERYL